MPLSSDYKPRVINLIVFPCSASISFGYKDGEVDFRELDVTGSAWGPKTLLLCHFSINENIYKDINTVSFCDSINFAHACHQLGDGLGDYLVLDSK